MICRCLPAVRPRHRRARHCGQRLPDEVRAEIVQLLFGKPLPGKRELEDRHARRAVADHQRRSDPRRHLPQRRLRRSRQLRHCRRHLHARLEEYLHQADPVQRLRFDVLDIVHRRRQDPFVDRRDTLFHLLRAQPRIVEKNTDDGNIDIGENIGRRPQNHQRTDQQNQQR